MNPTVHAVRVGLRRGWIEFVQSLRSAQDQGFYLFMALATLSYLYVRRNAEIEGTTLSYPTLAMPSILGALVAFGIVIGPAYALAMEREDGTLLRAKAIPNGMTGYVTGQMLYHSLGLVPMLVVILLPSMLLFDDLMHRGAAGWLTMLWVMVLGLLASLPIGIIIGSLVPSTQKVGTWGMMPIIVLAMTSGIFFPMDQLWGWVQGVAQVFPMYWLALGMRSAFLPDAAAAIEIGGSWRTAETVGVLLVWAVAGAATAPIVLRRMARRQSGSAVQAAREAAGQWVR
ncbi:MAG TPA: ABC transporter permease [Euzebya sp.]|nr:ABC transporter permease [Euzebya sp.]